MFNEYRDAFKTVGLKFAYGELKLKLTVSWNEILG